MSLLATVGGALPVLSPIFRIYAGSKRGFLKFHPGTIADLVYGNLSEQQVFLFSTQIFIIRIHERIYQTDNPTDKSTVNQTVVYLFAFLTDVFECNYDRASVVSNIKFSEMFELVVGFVPRLHLSHLELAALIRFTGHLYSMLLNT